jgi:hypothetical protein
VINLRFHDSKGMSLLLTADVGLLLAADVGLLLTSNVVLLLTAALVVLSADHGVFCARKFVLSSNLYSFIFNNNFKYFTPDVENLGVRTESGTQKNQSGPLLFQILLIIRALVLTFRFS